MRYPVCFRVTAEFCGGVFPQVVLPHAEVPHTHSHFALADDSSIQALTQDTAIPTTEA